MRLLHTFCAIALIALPILAQLEFPAEDPDVDLARCPAIPQLPNLTPLPDPFTFFNGKPVRTKEDWACRRAEISEFIQRYGLGRLPTSKPKVEGQLIKVDNSDRPYLLNVTVTEGEKTISFSAPFVVPKGEEVAPGRLPAIINIGVGTNLPAIPGVVHIFFNNDQMAEQNGLSSRGKGLFYDLYGANHSAGSLMAWAWGVGRIIDALEQVQKDSPVNAKRLGVTGCSRNGKGTVVAGAFEPRIALTIPQESGAGGTSCWRIQDALTGRGINTQTAAQIVTENTWHSRVFEDYVRKVGVLPYDQHLLTALIAPRAIYSPENGVISWLGPESSWGCQRAARSVWKALGVEDRIGIAQSSPEAQVSHCQFPETQRPGLEAFVNRFLKDQKVETDFFSSDAEFPQYSDKYWIQWETPRIR